MSRQTIARRAGVAPATITRLMQPTTTRISRITSAAILDVARSPYAITKTSAVARAAATVA